MGPHRGFRSRALERNVLDCFWQFSANGFLDHGFIILVLELGVSEVGEYLMLYCKHFI